MNAWPTSEKVITLGDRRLRVRPDADQPRNGTVRHTRVYVTVELARLADRRLGELLDRVRATPDDDVPTRLRETLDRRLAHASRRVALDTVRRVWTNPDIGGYFSRRAGCSCGCSPGVILDRTLRLAEVPVTVWVERFGG